ncbi:hypothetical protein ABT026_16935 [Streptomyces sp. NPDC002734]|uniref:hypothetical protein n=1 Tax=Streptomyces sp. NPDC002734 TaxID=3154426 RepID=UPI00331B56C8
MSDSPSQGPAVPGRPRNWQRTHKEEPAELHDEWIVFPRRYLSNESMDALYPDTPIVLPSASDD